MAHMACMSLAILSLAFREEKVLTLCYPIFELAEHSTILQLQSHLL